MSESIEARELALLVSGVTKRNEENIFEGAALSDISFSFEKKGIHAILAPKNSGKTRLMNILAGCASCDDGEVLIFGKPVGESADIKRRIGYVQKNCVLYSDMTAEEIMSFVGETRRVETGKLYRQIKEAMELVLIDGIKNKLVKNMSGFEQKKLSLAASLLGNPDMIFVDELITAKMSVEQREELAGILQMLGRMKTVVMSTDDFALARELCEDVVIILDGRVLAKGSFESLDDRLSRAQTPTTLEALYNSLASASAEN